MPITADQVKEVALKFGHGNLSELQITSLISIGLPAVLHWDDLKDLKSVNPKISRIGQQKRNNEFFLI